MTRHGEHGAALREARPLAAERDRGETLVVGATGRTGRRVVEQLRARGYPVRAASRSRASRFDWYDPASWDAALSGVRAAYVVGPHDAGLAPALVARAEELGVRRLVLLSGRGVDVPDYLPGYRPVRGAAGAELLDAECALRESALEWTILRPGWFAQSFSEGMFRDAVLAGDARLPAGGWPGGAVSYVDAEDVAAVAVAALTGDGHVGQVYELSGPRALTMAEAAAEIAVASGWEVRYVPLEPEEFVTERVARHGWPTAHAQQFTAGLSPIRRGLDAHLSDGVCRVLGREPRDFRQFARQAAAESAWEG